MTAHSIAMISFRDDLLCCGCGVRMSADPACFASHRKAAGQRPADVSSAAYSPDHSGSWSRTQTVADNRPRPRPSKGRHASPEDRIAGPCPWGHAPNWAINSLGARRCRTCDAARGRTRRLEQVTA